jgi:glycosyltransferase involved in cell wall biosynthesis
MPFPIAYIAGSFPMRSETFVYREVRELRRRGWKVQTVSLHHPNERDLPEFADLEASNLIVYAAPHRSMMRAAIAEFASHPLRAARTLLTGIADAIAPGERTSLVTRVKLIGQAMAGMSVARRLRLSDVRHIHCHFAHAPTSVGMYAAMHLGLPFSFTGHANDLFQRRALLKKKLNRAAFVACISQWHHEFYKCAGSAAPDSHLVVIRCGVPVEDWLPADRPVRRVLPADPIQVLTVCRLVEKKGVDTLLRGLQQFQARTGQSWRLTIGGDGPDAQKLKDLATELGVSGSCLFLGAVRNDRVRELLGQSDYFALACHTDSRGDRDGIPVVLMEAMACGVPVISGDLPAIRELIIPGESGLLIDGNRPCELTDAIDRLERDESLRVHLAEGGRARVQAEFSLQENVTRLERMFDNKR